MKKLFLILFLFSSLCKNAQTYNQKSYVESNRYGEIEFTEGSYGGYSQNIEYVKNSKFDGKTNSGYLFEYNFANIKYPISATMTGYYAFTIPVGHSLFPNGVKKGDRRELYNFSFIDGKLNGLQNIYRNTQRAGWKNVSAVAVINNIIVGRQRFADDFYDSPDWETKYKYTIMNEGYIYGYSLNYSETNKWSWSLQSLPENTYYNIEDLINIFLDDFMALDNHIALRDFVIKNEAIVPKNEIIAPSQTFEEKYEGGSGRPYNYQFLTSLYKWQATDMKIDAKFESLEGNAIAVSYGINKDDEVIIRIDPENWANASTPTKWYILYHELGHDILNLEHGQGGRMMFNFPLKDYTWEEFFEDRDFMFDYVLEKKYENYKLHIKPMIRWKLSGN